MTIRALILLTIGVICCGTALAAYQPDELVERLRKEQPIAALRPEQTAKALKENIDRNYVLIMFTQTGTELGITLDRGLCRLNEANFETAKGTVVLVGTVTLNNINCRFTGTIDVSTCGGTGYLERIF